MILIRYRGGLGNQMFQYAFQLAVQQKYTDVSVLADLSHYTLNHEHNGFELQKYFEIELQTARENEIRRFSPYYAPSSFVCKLPAAARNFLTEHYQYRYAEKEKKKRGKALFYRKTVWKTRVKLWNNHFLPKNLWKTTCFSPDAPQNEERCL